MVKMEHKFGNTSTVHSISVLAAPALWGLNVAFMFQVPISITLVGAMFMVYTVFRVPKLNSADANVMKLGIGEPLLCSICSKTPSTKQSPAGM